MKLIIRNTTGIPIYEQIKDQLRVSIYSGELKEGEVLPSIRQLARDLKISVITTGRAYGDLEQEGLLASVPGKGFFVLPQNQELLREQALREMEEHLTNAITAARQAGITHEELTATMHLLMKEEQYE